MTCGLVHASYSLPEWQAGDGKIGRTLGDPFNKNSHRSDREKWSTSKGGPVFSKLFRLDQTDPLGFRPKFLEILVEWIVPPQSSALPFLFKEIFFKFFFLGTASHWNTLHNYLIFILT